MVIKYNYCGIRFFHLFEFRTETEKKSINIKLFGSLVFVDLIDRLKRSKNYRN